VKLPVAKLEQRVPTYMWNVGFRNDCEPDNLIYVGLKIGYALAGVEIILPNHCHYPGR